MQTATGFGIMLMLCSYIGTGDGKDSIWSMKNIKEADRNCLKCACMGQPLNEKYRPTISALMDQKLYSVFASKLSYAWCYVLIQGKLVTSNNDVDKMCRSRMSLPGPGYHLQIGFGFNVTTVMKMKKLLDMSVYNIEQRFDPFEMSEAEGKMYYTMTSAQRVTIVWTDGDKSFLGTFCLWDGQTGWYLHSVDKFLNPKLKRTVLKKIKALGFNPANAYAADYQNCVE